MMSEQFPITRRMRDLALFDGRGKRIHLFLLLLMVSIFLATDCGAVNADATLSEDPAQSAPPSPTGLPSLTLEQCVGQILTQSPYMKLHDLKVEIKGLDANDAWYQMFPKIDLALSSNIPINPEKNSSEASFSVSLTSGSYDPITANISHSAQLKLIRLAKSAKLETATKLIMNTAASYLREKAHATRMQYFDELLDLARENLAFNSQKYVDAPTVPLDVRLAQYRIDHLKAEKNSFITTRQNERMQLKRLLGIPAEQKIQFETKGVPDTLFRTFNADKLTFEQVRSQSIKAQMEKLSLELADNNILAAWAQYVPKFNFSIRTPDPINNDTTKDESYYFTLGVSAPLWHWGEISRGRQRAELQKSQAKIEYQGEWLKIEDEWYEARSKVHILKDSCILADTSTELQALRVRKAEILFNAGRVKYDEYVTAQMALLRTKIDAIAAQEEYQLAKLDAYTKSGQLLRRFVTVTDDTDENN